MLARSAALVFSLTLAISTAAQNAPALRTVAPFPRPDLLKIPVIRQAVKPNKPLTITGARGAILGEQSGVMELWQLPVKVFSGLRLKAQIDGYTVPLELNPGAATVEVRPGHTVLTYSFAGITVRQHMLVSPAQEGDVNQEAARHDPGALIYFDIEAVRAATLTVTLMPAMQQQWPAPQYGIPGASWLPMSPDGPFGAGGAYMIATDNPRLFGMIGMPNSRPGDVPVYQEHPQTLPLQFLVRYDPAKDRGRLFPLLSTVSQPGEAISQAQVRMQQRLADQAAMLPELAQRIDFYYAHFFDKRLTVQTPDPRFDEALRWAELSIEDAQVEHRTDTGGQVSSGPVSSTLEPGPRDYTPNLKSETGLVAGWFPSYDSTRPGFGWYFGRDTLWSLYAIDSYGDGALAKRALEFLLRRQRADGKMMHEFSQMADDLPTNMAWSSFGYEYAAADATPLFPMAMLDYVRTTGDLDFLRQHWEQVKLAYHFERTHDSDGDGVYDNSQGTGWVENWQSPMPHQELYLASLDQQAAASVAELASLMHDDMLRTAASTDAVRLAKAVEAYRGSDGLYAFSKNADGSYDRTLTVYPSVALWKSAAGLAQPGPMLRAWSSPLLATDWGTRAVAENVSFYDPISYHMGSVWPLFTGWNAMAQYRTGNSAAGWATLQQNLRLTFAEDPGAVTEVISGRFYQPLGRSSAHQLWSSAMTLAPAVRGLFGIDVDSTHRALNIHPQLPVRWEGAELDNVRVGDDFYHVTMKRVGAAMKVTVSSVKPTALCLNTAAAASCTPTLATVHESNVPLPRVELGLHDEPGPEPGDETHLPHILAETHQRGTVSLRIAAIGGSVVDVDQRSNGRLAAEPLHVHMPAGSGFVEALCEASPN